MGRGRKDTRRAESLQIGGFRENSPDLVFLPVHFLEKGADEGCQNFPLATRSRSLLTLGCLCLRFVAACHIWGGPRGLLLLFSLISLGIGRRTFCCLFSMFTLEVAPKRISCLYPPSTSSGQALCQHTGLLPRPHLCPHRLPLQISGLQGPPLDHRLRKASLTSPASPISRL